MTYFPTERSYQEGSAVKLSCEAVGQPPPQISWSFNGEPIVASRKYVFTTGKHQLTIYPFLEQDVGQYSCEAVNPSGRVKKSARIGLLHVSPPVVVEGPKSVTVKLGKRATFRCKAKGEPTPTLTWFFNGGEIQKLNGHFRVSDDGRELTVEQVSRQDNGVFSCMASNNAGSMTGDARLVVELAQVDAILEAELGSENLRSIVQEASSNVDRAIQQAYNYTLGKQITHSLF